MNNPFLFFFVFAVEAWPSSSPFLYKKRNSIRRMSYWTATPVWVINQGRIQTGILKEIWTSLELDWWWEQDAPINHRPALLFTHFCSILFVNPSQPSGTKSRRRLQLFFSRAFVFGTGRCDRNFCSDLTLKKRKIMKKVCGSRGWDD